MNSRVISSIENGPSGNSSASQTVPQKSLSGYSKMHDVYVSAAAMMGRMARQRMSIRFIKKAACFRRQLFNLYADFLLSFLLAYSIEKTSAKPMTAQIAALGI